MSKQTKRRTTALRRYKNKFTAQTICNQSERFFQSAMNTSLCLAKAGNQAISQNIITSFPYLSLVSLLVPERVQQEWTFQYGLPFLLSFLFRSKNRAIPVRPG